MQINRLFEIVYILLDKKIVTAKELAERFSVSVRTIYRDVETLSSAGIPIYMVKGNGGGISLLENFVLNKSVLSESEQNEILSALHGLKLLNLPDAASVLDKLGTFFNKNASDWIEIDFSYWGSDESEKEKFNSLKSAVLSKRIITFDYFAPNREKTSHTRRIRRTVEPLQIFFKDKAWYLKAFCTEKQDYRTFKITRMKNIEVTDTIFIREPQKINTENFCIDSNTIKVVLKFFEPAFNRVYDELGQQCIISEDEDSVTAEILLPDAEWICSYVMSFGNTAEVLAPQYIRDTVAERLKEAADFYKTD